LQVVWYILNTDYQLQKKSIHSSNIAWHKGILHGICHLSDQVADIFYQQVIDNEQKNSLNTKSDSSSCIKVDLVEEDIPKLSYFDPSGAHDTNVKRKPCKSTISFRYYCHEEC
jgi:hypothetical protein